ncbi:MAG: hypothetical protein Q9M33_11100, partial [Robiginitomaculum sp.]|nr:hypothetical protein [Robiginitomaculum sp.]
PGRRARASPGSPFTDLRGRIMEAEMEDFEKHWHDGRQDRAWQSWLPFLFLGVVFTGLALAAVRLALRLIGAL